MSARPSIELPPADQRPDHPELETTNEEFLSDLEEKMDAPPTWQEQKSAFEAVRDTDRLMQDFRKEDAEPASATLDRVDMTMAKLVGEGQWAKLDRDTVMLYNQARETYQHIGAVIRPHHGQTKFDKIETHARTVREGLDAAEQKFRTGDIDVLDFSQAVNFAVAELGTIESRLPKHSS